MEEKLRRAFQLAYFILREEQAALVATRESVSALDVMLFRQDKRVHYAPSHRTKVSLGEWQMLQRLVYFASEPEERRQEERGVSEEALVMHYIKHLVYITGRRNSFFVALGLSRLLHNYTTAEAVQIHELVSQDPDRGRDDSYYRRRKAQLMRELQDRFGELLAVQRGLRGEERFQALLDAQGYLAWVRECLREFTPWETSCNLPAAFDPHTDELPSLCFRGNDPDGEHEVEIRRLHALLHPDCFGRLLAALRLDAPDKRLELPEFKLRAHNPPEPPGCGQSPTARLSVEDMQSLKKSIAQEREHRRRFSPTSLRIVVDRVERARWPIEQSRSPQVEIAPDDSMVEIYGVRDGENIRLGAHMLSYDLYDQLRPVASTLTLEGGQELRLDIEPMRAAGWTGPEGKEEERARATIAVSYRETAPIRVLLWKFSRIRLRLFNSSQLRIWKPALAFILLISSGATVGYWLWNSQPAPSDDLAGAITLTPRVSPTTAAVASISPQPGRTAEPAPPTPRPLSFDEVIAIDIRPRAGKTDGPGELITRGAGAPGAGLLEAKKIYLEISGARREQARRIFLRRLPSGARFSLTDNQDEADVALKVKIASARMDRLALTVHIIDSNGKVIWPLTAGATARKYEGPLEKVIETFNRDLLGDIQRLERQK